MRDIPEAITQGDDVELALKEASDCLEEAIAADQRDLPIRTLQVLGQQISLTITSTQV
ncbi:type II toxin-antitoxin system HicB family antitoxin [Crocosphaera sp. Alani8]|uniref:type II toxin-antitoxin system HicB family antitoxin n=1 Tax=Crocosphaera sp. Alani8 TaxID=3038952 RepID=UPI00313D08B7